MNPFEEKPMQFDHVFEEWKALYPKSYRKEDVDPYTKARVILMNGAEFDGIFSSHDYSRQCNNNDLRRELALLRRSEQLQQKKVANLKPTNETVLEHTISYEQLAVDLSAILAKRERNAYVKQALEFALVEDFDHLYRYADLLELEEGTLPEKLVGGYTEIMPGRPTISGHRHPYDDIRRWVDYKVADPITKLNVGIIIAAEQQCMNYYMNVVPIYKSDLGRKLYQEIGTIEEQHVSHYGSLKDTNLTNLENLLLQQYMECYLYYSCYMDETDRDIKKIWEQHFSQEVAHLHKAARLLEKYEGKEWSQIITDGKFPELLSLHSNKNYIREVLKSVDLTTQKERYTSISELPKDYEYFDYQSKVNHSTEEVPTHMIINQFIKERGMDYRYQEAEHPVGKLKSRDKDNIMVGRDRKITVK